MRFLNPIGASEAGARRAQGRDPVRYRRTPGPARRRGRSNRRLLARIGLASLALSLAAGAIWSWTGGWAERSLLGVRAAMLEATGEAGLRVEDVLVEGRGRSTRSAVLDALDVDRDVPILGFDPHAARARLERLPWVRQAAVERRLPNVVYLRLVERVPLALWQHEGRIAVIDRDGEAIPGADPRAFASLPLVVGDDAPGHAVELLAMLDSEPELKPRVSAAVRVRGRRWNLRLDGAIDVRLPERDPATAWSELARIQRQHGVLGRDVTIIDMRMPDRLIVRTTPGSELAPDRSQAGEET